MHEKDLLSFDRVHREWVWSAGEITGEPPSENVSIKLVHQLQNLDETTINLLQIASCIGIEFDLELLQMVSELSFAETSTRLSVAIQQGYLLQIRTHRKTETNASCFALLMSGFSKPSTISPVGSNSVRFMPA